MTPDEKIVEHASALGALLDDFGMEIAQEPLRATEKRRRAVVQALSKIGFDPKVLTEALRMHRTERPIR